MALRIRRHSMEHLELFDLDQPLVLSSPLSTPLHTHRHHLPTSHPYHFLCDKIRHQTDPIYGKTPMFTTIPHSKHVRYHRRILGSHLPSRIVRPITTKYSKLHISGVLHGGGDEQDDESSEDDSEQTSDDDESEEEEDDNQGQSKDCFSSSSSSSDSSSSSGGEDYGLDYGDGRGIIEQMFDVRRK